MKKIAIGIDFSKKTFDVTIKRRVDNDFIELGYSKFDNNEKGFKCFISWVRKSVKHLPEGKGRASWIFCGENTGICSAALSDYLVSKGFDMWLESALQIKRCSGIVRTKDDRDDSSRIADYALRYFNSDVHLHQLATDAYKKLRALYTLHNILTKDMVAKNNQIKSGTLDASPEALKLANRQLGLIREQLKDVDRQIERMLKENDEFSENYRIMDSIKGIGSITACCIIVKTHNFKYMADARTFGNFAGVVPSHREQSGTSVDRSPHLSKCRDKAPKATLSQAVNLALRYNPTIRTYCDRLVGRGVHINKAKNNCKFKLINIIMFFIKKKTAYDIEKYGVAKKKWNDAV